MIASAQQGSRQAYAQLMTLHQDRLYRFLVVRTRCDADAQDALQETFLCAYRSIKTYRRKWAFTTWLYRIGLRELARLSTRQDSHGGPELEPIAAGIQDLDRENLWTEVRALLTPAQFDVIWLLYAEDFPVKSIAQTMSKSIPWVKITAYRARSRLSAALTNDWRSHCESASLDTDTMEGHSHANV